MIAQPLGIIGIGVIGGSIGLRARSRGIRVIGFDRDPQNAERAVASGAVDALAHDLESVAARAGTLVVALPLDSTIDALERLETLPPPQLIVDVASVKAPLAPFCTRLVNFVATHPMAGREGSGVAVAQAALFEAATWAFVPPANAELDARVRAFIVEMGGVPLSIDAARHDRIVAFTSHLPQALSVTLGRELAVIGRADPDVIKLCGPGIRSMLRLARSSESMWAPIVAANGISLASRLRAIARELDTIANALDTGDGSRLMSYFSEARGALDALEEPSRPLKR